MLNIKKNNTIEPAALSKIHFLVLDIFFRSAGQSNSVTIPSQVFFRGVSSTCF